MRERVSKVEINSNHKIGSGKGEGAENGKVEKGARKSFILPPQPASRLEKRNANMKQS